MRRPARERARLDQRVAVVEEIADNIYSIKFILQSLGYQVVSFSSNRSCLEELNSFRPHLIIVDMMIPHRLGYRVIEQLQRSALSDIPILAITAAAMEGKESEVLASGCCDLLAKPYSVSDLQSKLQRWLPQES